MSKQMVSECSHPNQRINTYTSVGSVEGTHPNPQLRYITESGRIAYHPAYTLNEKIYERIGRVHTNTKLD
ncbi:unnamed protein product [Schistosoma turkestanicum]|nr:unnamed protein product [Schistosoma turkestanicum]